MKISKKKDHLSERYRPKPKVENIRGIKNKDNLMPIDEEVSEKPLAWGVELYIDEAAFLTLPASIADLPQLDVERTFGPWQVRCIENL